MALMSSNPQSVSIITVLLSLTGRGCDQVFVKNKMDRINVRTFS